MRNIYLIAAAMGFLAFGVVASADGAEKAPKPVVCLDYHVADAETAVCRDSKKPFLMRNFDEIRTKRPDGTVVSVLVGWR